ncbi:MAG: phytoene/squalene synthase family protein [Ilumatobacteraceae bacterium]
MTVSLEASYAHCRGLNRRFGTTYFWATYALPRVKRHHVWALYAFCRYADDIVDDLGDAPVEQRRAALEAFEATFFADLERGHSDDIVLKAVVHTVKAFGHDPEMFHRFLRSMTMDLTIATYDTYDDLLVYMDGSAAVIGEMMLPILEPDSPLALPRARDLGNAFQLTNFVRDIEEDLQRGRMYIPQEDLARFGVDLGRRVVDQNFIDLMKFEIERCRDLYRSADEGIVLLPGASARCVKAARTLYSQILDRIESSGYDVFNNRARVPTINKVATAAKVALLGA